MPDTLLDRIEQAESEAQQIRQQAQKEARDIAKAVEEASASNERDEARAMHDVASRHLEQTRQAADDEIKSLQLRRESERDALKRIAQARISPASTALFERIVGHGHR